MKNTLAIGLIIAAAATIGVAQAGYKAVQGIYVEPAYGGSGAYAYGILSTVRYSADSNQYIGCSVDSSGSATCSARNSASNYFYCYTSDPKMVEAIKTISEHSFLYMISTDGSRCAYITVDNASQYLR